VTTTSAAVEAVWRIESGRLVGLLTRLTGDFATAEDVAQDALEAALRQWPNAGIPPNPAGWLTVTARHIAADRYRHDTVLQRKLPLLAAKTRLAEMEDPMTSVAHTLDDPVHDDLLRLMFIACHPALTMDSQVALTLRTVGGLQTRSRRNRPQAGPSPRRWTGGRRTRGAPPLSDRLSSRSTCQV